MTELEQQVEDLAHALAGARSAAVLTGAGISTESGLPDYRGPNGMWRNRRFEQLASIEMFRREPEEFWAFYRERLATLRDAAPNAGHEAIAQLERAGVTAPVLTQNVDGLHARAGSDPVELHGSLRVAECIVCGARVDMDEAERRMAAVDDGVPQCDCGSALKPGVTLFGELLPMHAIERAEEIVEACDLLLVCGSSLAVSPVSNFAWHVAHNGGTLAIVNRGETEADHLATLRIDAALGDTLPDVARLVLG